MTLQGNEKISLSLAIDHYTHLLCKHEEYDAVIDFVTQILTRVLQSDPEFLSSLPHGSIVMLLGSLAKTSSLTPQEALEKARQFEGLVGIDNARINLLLAWLAYR